MEAIFPIFVQDKEKWMYMISNSEALNNLEVIDINNNEYAGWDKEGKPIEFHADNNEIKVRCLSNDKQVEILKKAILDYVGIVRPKKPFAYDNSENDMAALFRAAERHIKDGSVFYAVKRLFKKSKR